MSNPGAAVTQPLDRFASLAMTDVGGRGFSQLVFSDNTPGAEASNARLGNRLGRDLGDGAE